MSQDEPSLAMVLQRWIDTERLRPIDVERAGGPSRNHLWMILRGRIRRPDAATLRRLATALATAPKRGAVDAAKERRALSELSRAAGYPDLALATEPGSLDAALEADGVDNPQVRAFYRRFIAAHRAPNPMVQELLEAVAAHFDRPGGDGGVGLLLDVLGRPEPPELLLPALTLLLPTP